MRRRSALFGWALLLATPALSGLLDSPPPRIESMARLQVVYRMGAIYYEPGRVDSVIECRNESASAALVALEIFDMNDARVGALTSRTLPPGASVSFATSSGAGPASRAVIPDLPPLAYGKARVSATTQELGCSGSWRARSQDGTTKDSPLQLVKKVGFGPKP